MSSYPLLSNPNNSHTTTTIYHHILSSTQDIQTGLTSHNIPTPPSPNLNIRQKNLSTNSISSNISSHSSINIYPLTVSHKFLTNNSSEQPIQTIPTDNHYINGNLLYGDPKIEHPYPASKIIYNNINGLDLSTHCETLETICD